MTEDEIQRLRDRLHHLEGTTPALLWRTERLEEQMRTLTGVVAGIERVKWLEEQVRALIPKVAELAEADRIANAVMERLREVQTLKLSRGQWWFGCVVAFAALADIALRLSGLSG